MFERERHPLRNWMRNPILIGFLRVMVPLAQVVTGHPFRRYSEVLPSLWVGGQHYAHGVKKMQKDGLTAIVNLRTAPDDAALKRTISDNYLWLPTTDHTPPSLDDIQHAVDFIRNEIDAGGKVYVHCREGVGRAPTTVACYLVSQGYNPQEAWQKIRDVRPFLYPMPSQIAQVENYYYSLQTNTHTETTMTISDA